MKKTAFLAAAAALVAATPAAAQGYLGARYSTADADILGVSDDLDSWQGEGEFGWNSGGWGGQFGGSFGNTEFDGGGDTDFWAANLHIYWDGGAWKLGGVVATTNADDVDSDETAYGIEGMWDVGPNSNLYGALTFGTWDFFGLTDFDTWNLDVGGNFYSSPNMRFGAMIGTGNVDAGGGVDASTMSAGLNAEFQPWSAPVSITLAYNYYDIDDFDTTSSAFSVGARWNFGGGTIQDRNNATPFSANSGNLNRVLAIY
jgi:hypothetical protein